MTDVSLLCEDLKIWFQRFDIKRKTIEHFLDFVKNYALETDEIFDEKFPDFDEKNLMIEVRNMEFCIGWGEDYPYYMVVTIPIIYNNIHIGSFATMFNDMGRASQKSGDEKKESIQYNESTQKTASLRRDSLWTIQHCLQMSRDIRSQARERKKHYRWSAKRSEMVGQHGENAMI